jgi:hypothetical protein
MDKESPPLIKSISAVPAIIAGTEIKTDNFIKDPNPWTLGYSFMYDNWKEYTSLFKYGRCVIIFLGCLLGYFIYQFGSEVYGRKGGLFSLLLYILNPSIIAHSGLLTIDIGASCAILLSIYCFWKHLEKRSPHSTLYAGITLGLAQLSKFTALLLYPIFFIIITIIAVSRFLFENSSNRAGLTVSSDTNRSLLLEDIGLFSLIVFISILVINAGYLFSGSLLPVGEYHFSSQGLKTFSSLLFQSFPVPLPYDYLDGFDSQLVISEGSNPFYSSYLMGEYSLTGWWYYYLIAFFVKTPPALLIILSLAIYLHIKTGLRDNLPANLCLWVPITAYLLYFSFFTRIYIGIRFILPVFPLIFIAAGITCKSPLSTGKKMSIFINAMIVFCFLSVIFSYPNYLSYFNAISGGPGRGHEWLIDSNLDWGQDLPELKKYMDHNKIESIKLGYFGRVDPELYGIKYTLPGQKVEKGLYGISINFLKGKPYYLLDNKNKKLIYADSGYFKDYSTLKPFTVINNTIYIFDNRDNTKVSE